MATLKRSEDVKELLFQGSSDLMLYLDTFGRILRINKAGLAFSGFSEEEVIGKMFWKLPGVFLKRNVPKYLKVFKNTLTGKETKGFLGNLNDKSGKIHLMEFSVYPIKENRKIKCVLVIGKDVGEQNEIEEKYRLIGEHTSDLVALVTFTLNPTYTYASPSHEKVLGYESKDLIGKSIFDFIHPDDKKNIVPLLKKYVSAKAKKLLTGKNRDVTESLEFRFKDKSGNWHYLETTVNLMGNEILTVSRDVTERKQAGEELKKYQRKIEQQNIKLKKLDKIKSDFLNVTSHELRTPMSAIKGYVQMLLNRSLGEISEEQKRGLEVILRNANRLDNLVQDILDISRLESGTMKFIVEKTDIQKMIDEVTETMQSSADLKDIKIKMETEEKLPSLNIDQDRIKQVIMNLVNNAIKFSPDGSIINIRAKREEDNILFEVQDFGKGIPGDKQKKIFDIFYQVESSKNTKFGGAGLGLSISRGIILAHGGEIWVESTLNEGSTFRFTLPVNPVKDIEKRFKAINIFGLKDNNWKQKLFIKTNIDKSLQGEEGND
ncbi:MAG: PAS domain S-box protein [Thermoplasmatales archaeon]|nr:PAS domain S-box protein [Thermoplasmatales archaeon]